MPGLLASSCVGVLQVICDSPKMTRNLTPVYFSLVMPVLPHKPYVARTSARCFRLHWASRWLLGSGTEEDADSVHIPCYLQEWPAVFLVGPLSVQDLGGERLQGKHEMC